MLRMRCMNYSTLWSSFSNVDQSLQFETYLQNENLLFKVEFLNWKKIIYLQNINLLN